MTVCKEKEIKEKAKEEKRKRWKIHKMEIKEINRTKEEMGWGFGLNCDVYRFAGIHSVDMRPYGCFIFLWRLCMNETQCEGILNA